jgi:hypothetical protein
VPCCGTCCAFLWHIVLCSLLRDIANEEFQVKNCKSRIASQELQVKNCKSRIASQELQVKNCKSRITSQELQKKSFRQFGHIECFFSLVFDNSNKYFSKHLDTLLVILCSKMHAALGKLCVARPKV